MRKSSVSGKLSEAAKELGREHGSKQGEVVNDRNCNVEAARKIINGHEDGDPKIMDFCPNPLSGEWADDPTPMALLDEIANKVEDPQSLRGDILDVDTENILDVYEEAYRDAFWESVLNTCKEIINHD